MKASIGRRLPCETSLGWRVSCVLLTIVFSVGSAVPLAGQEPAVNPRQFTPAPSKPPSGASGKPPSGTWSEDKHSGKSSSGTWTDDKHSSWHKSPRPPPPPPPSPWAIILGVWAAIIFLAFFVRKLLYPPPPPLPKTALKPPPLLPKTELKPPLPRIEVVPFKDYGEQQVAPRPLVFAVELCPVIDPGDQELDKVGPLVEQRGG